MINVSNSAAKVGKKKSPQFLGAIWYFSVIYLLFLCELRVLLGLFFYFFFQSLGNSKAFLKYQSFIITWCV